MKKLFLSLLLISPSLSQATSGHMFYRYFTYLNFSDRYLDRTVEAVYAHVGVDCDERGFENNARKWLDVQHVEMKRQGDHFFAKAELSAEFHTHYGPAPKGPIVQFWVYLDNGELAYAEETPIPQTYVSGTINAYEPEDILKSPVYLDYKQNSFEQTSSTPKTRADVLVGGYSS